MKKSMFVALLGVFAMSASVQADDHKMTMDGMKPCMEMKDGKCVKEEMKMSDMKSDKMMTADKKMGDAKMHSDHTMKKGEMMNNDNMMKSDDKMMHSHEMMKSDDMMAKPEMKGEMMKK